jgi:hypothetical protein
MSNIVFDNSKGPKWFPLLETPEFELLIKQLQISDCSPAEIFGIQKLFYLLNLNPRLTAHKRVFENLLAFFELDTFKTPHQILRGEWCNYVNVWVSVLKVILSESFALESIIPTFNLDRSQLGGHPMSGLGMTRHPQASAIWARHESTEYYPPAVGNSDATNYFRLQAHFCLCQLKSRSSTNFSEYLEHSASSEHAPRSPLTVAISTNLRDCFSAELNGVVRDLNPTLETSVFLQNSRDVKLKSESVTESNRAQLHGIFNSIKVHFKGMLREFERGRKKREVGEITSVEAGKDREYLIHPGCRMVVKNVWLSPPMDDFNDDEYSVDSGQEVFLLGGDKAQDDADIRSGSAPFENPKPLLKLYFKSEIGGAMTRARQQHQARELTQQNLSWDYQYLTIQEYQMVTKVLSDRYFEFIHSTSKFSQSQLSVATAVLVLKIENAFSVSTAVALSTVFTPLDEVEPDGRLALQYGGPDGYRWSLPAVSPSYRDSVDWDQTLNQPITSRIYLPDVFSLGPEIEAYVHKTGTGGPTVFHSNESTVRKGCNKLLKGLGDERITQTKMRKSISVEIQKRSRDPTVAWFLSANFSKKNDSRMFYARYPIEILGDIYRESALALLGTVSDAEPPRSMLSRLDQWHGPSVGARYVMQVQAFKSLVSTLSTASHTKPDFNSVTDVIEYHNRYLVYVLLFQNICTSHRSINNPVSIFNYWVETSLLFAPLADKDNEAEELARLSLIPSALAQQFEHYQRHLHALKQIFPQTTKGEKSSAFFWLDHKQVAHPVTEGWLEVQYADLGFRIPANFHRSMMRFELNRRGCSVDSTPAYLGHAGVLEAFHGPRSTFSYFRHAKEILLHINAILAEANLIPIASGLQVPLR